jgi:hypothetical protein
MRSLKPAVAVIDCDHDGFPFRARVVAALVALYVALLVVVGLLGLISSGLECGNGKGNGCAGLILVGIVWFVVLWVMFGPGERPTGAGPLRVSVPPGILRSNPVVTRSP